jgi:hypothetical protein
MWMSPALQSIQIGMLSRFKLFLSNAAQIWVKVLPGFLRQDDDQDRRLKKIGG